MEICDAFQKAKAAVEFQFKRTEAELFTIMLDEDKTSKNGQKPHVCYHL